MLLLLLLVTPPAPPHMWGSSRAGATGLPAPPRGGGWGVETAWCHRLLLLLLSGSWAGGVEPTPLLVPHGWGGGGGGVMAGCYLGGEVTSAPEEGWLDPELTRATHVPKKVQSKTTFILSIY